MKDIKNFIFESNNGWNYFKDVYDPSGAGLKLNGLNANDVKWIYIDIDKNTICPYTENNLTQATKDLEDDYLENELNKLKVGESYNENGKIYIKIK